MIGRPETVRLLPWAGPEGKPCYLVGDGSGYVSKVADDIETLQLDMGADLLDHAAAMLADPKASAGEIRFLATRLSEALNDALRVAESRGARLPAPDYGDPDEIDADDNDDGPTLPAEAFG